METIPQIERFREEPSAPTALHWIGGQWLDSGEHRESINPATGEVQATVALASDAEILAAVQSAKAAQPKWAATNPQRSGPYLSRQWCVDKYELAAQRLMGRPAAQLPWTTKIEKPGVMDLITPDEVNKKIHSVLIALARREGLTDRMARARCRPGNDQPAEGVKAARSARPEGCRPTANSHAATQHRADARSVRAAPHLARSLRVRERPPR